MTLSPGTRLGPYDIVAPIGAGGMGEVFRARDTKLNRDVAIKVLPAEFASDSERVARFKREAQILASLNHPHIAAVYGLEESGTGSESGSGIGTVALIMEYVEGDDLAQRLRHGAIPADEAISIAKQIAGALEEAHEQGIVHRDLKPANVKVTPDGKVKVLDFGLAKAMGGPSGSGPGPESAAENQVGRSPTLTLQGTEMGVILGSAAYMSPEQARGKKVDKRSDIWSFGVVLFEMLSGRRLFTGDTVADVLASVLTREPAWSTLPENTPSSVTGLLKRCLARDPKSRLRDVGEARLALVDAGSSDAWPGLPAAPGGPAGLHGPARRVERARAPSRTGSFFTTALVAVVFSLVGAWVATRPKASRVSALAIATTPATAVTVSGGDRAVGITPDGSRVLYVGNHGRDLFVRPMDATDPASVYRGTPRAPFASPDGLWVGFIDSNTTLKKIAMNGGPATTLATLDGGSRGAVWLPDDTIVLATAAAGTGLQQVSAGGGPVTVLTRPDREHGEGDHVWPEALPGGEAVLFTIVPATGGVDAAQIAVFDRKTKEKTVVLRGGSHARYVASGHLLFYAGGALRAVAFDARTRTTRGTPTPVVSEVVTTGAAPAGGVEAGVATDGTMIYVRGRPVSVQRGLVWVDREGRETPLSAPPRAYDLPRVSPDGSRIVVWATDQENDLWIWDMARLSLTRLTFAPGVDLFPVWTPDGRRVLFSSSRDGIANLYAQAADGSGTAERLTTSPNPQNSTAVTPDGTKLIFTELAPGTRGDVLQVNLTGGLAVTPLVQTPADERNGVVSPDGRWLAYEADDSGRMEIYVRPYPEVSRGRWQVSSGGGQQPRWSRDGHELFFASPQDALLHIIVENGPSWRAGTPSVVLREGTLFAAAGAGGATYDVSPDGRRFLVVKEAADLSVAPPQIIVVQHFDEVLKGLAPGK